jgi:N-acetyl-anhydromuramyl-L-alanine amidase AmpD
MQSLGQLLAGILERHDIDAIIGHQEVSSIRADPGKCFSWAALHQLDQVRTIASACEECKLLRQASEPAATCLPPEPE